MASDGTDQVATVSPSESVTAVEVIVVWVPTPVPVTATSVRLVAVGALIGSLNRSEMRSTLFQVTSEALASWLDPSPRAKPSCVPRGPVANTGSAR